MDYSEQRDQHIEDTRYLKWTDGMYVYLEDLECDYELAVIENSLRDSVYFDGYFNLRIDKMDNCIGVLLGDADYWNCKSATDIKLTRAQALYIATGDVSI